MADAACFLRRADPVRALLALVRGESTKRITAARDSRCQRRNNRCKFRSLSSNASSRRSRVDCERTIWPPCPAESPGPHGARPSRCSPYPPAAAHPCGFPSAHAAPSKPATPGPQRRRRRRRMRARMRRRSRLLGQDVRVLVAELMEQPRRALDVGKEDGDSSRRQSSRLVRRVQSLPPRRRRAAGLRRTARDEQRPTARTAPRRGPAAAT